MAEYQNHQYASTGAGQAQPQPFNQEQLHHQYQSVNRPPSPSTFAPEVVTMEHPPPMPPRPVGDAPQPTNILLQPTPNTGLTKCPRCSYNNRPSVAQCEVCEADLPTAMSDAPPAYAPTPGFPPPPTPSFPPPPGSSVSGSGPHTAPPVFAPPPGSAPVPSSHKFGTGIDAAGFAPPPKRHRTTFVEDDDPSNPIHYTRDPHKLVAYIIPLPTPRLQSAPTDEVPKRFLVYTPPPPPLKKPTLEAGQKEERLHIVQRKWQDELRKAKNSQERNTSWKGLHHKMVRGTNKAMSLTTSANLDFLGRASPGTSGATTPERKHTEDGVEVPHEAEKTVSVDEMVFIYPASMGTNEVALREEFINTLMRTKSKAQRDSVIATGLVPVGFAIDFVLVVVGGLGEIATVWAFKSIMGAKTARSISKRLASAEAQKGAGGQLKLSFKPSSRMEVLKDYLDAECSRIEPQMFPRMGQYHIPPTETQVITAIGWSPHQSGGETRNWEDEQWELSEVKEDFKTTIHKGAKEWRKWCQGYEKDWDKKQRDQRSERNEKKYAEG